MGVLHEKAHGHALLLYVIVCGAGPAADIATLVVAAQQRGWVVC
jgi:hypothetical protein